jgi:hypothetical protein
MVGSPDLISFSGEVGRMYEANVDDVGYRLVALYTPVREDGVEGIPVLTSTEQIAVEPKVLKDVKQKLELGAVKFEALQDRDRSLMKSQVQGLGSLERPFWMSIENASRLSNLGQKLLFQTQRFVAHTLEPLIKRAFQHKTSVHAEEPQRELHRVAGFESSTDRL